MILALVIPVLFGITVPNATISIRALAPGLICACASLRLAQLLVSTQPMPALATLWSFVYVFLGLAPLLQHLSGFYPWFDTPVERYDSNTLVIAVLAILLGLISVELGYRRSAQRGRGKNWIDTVIVERTISRARLAIVTVVGVGAAAAIVILNGGIAALFVARAEAVDAQLYAAGGEGLAKYLLVNFGLSVLVVTAFLLRLADLRQRRNAGLSTNTTRALTVGLGVLTFVVNNPISTPRFWFGTIALSTVLMHWPWHRRYATAGLVITVLAALIVVFPLSDVYRYSLDVDLAERIGSSHITSELATKQDYDAFQQIVSGVDFANTRGHQYGAQLLGSVAFWIPRAIWPQKPVSTGELIAQHQGYAFSNLSMPLWGEFYVDGGLVLVMLGFFCYGVFLARFDAAIARDRAGASIAILVPVVFAAYQMYLLRGSLMIAVSYFAPLIALFMCSTRRVTKARMQHRQRNTYPMPSN